LLRIGGGGVDGVQAVVLGLQVFDEDIARRGMAIAGDMRVFATASRATDQLLVKAHISRRPLRLPV
jgi:hypothetical protein